MLGLLVAASPLEHVVSHDLFHVGPIVVNNHMLMSAVAALLMLIVFVPMTRYRSLVPSGVRNFFESICVYFRDEVARPILHDETDRFIGVIWTTFFFILFANLLGIIPIAAIVYLVSWGELHEWGGTATGNIYVTGALAGFMFVFIHLSGIAQNVRHQRHAGRSPITAGLFGVAVYLYKMVPHIEGALGIILFLPLLGLEFLGAVVKSVALAIRLFANMIAGHILLAVLLFFITFAQGYLSGFALASVSVVGSVAITLLELFVAFLQAYIFTFLATIFIGMAVHQDH